MNAAPGSGEPPRRPRLTALRVSAETLDIMPAPARRAWMDTTPDRFADRCLPLLMANQSGWFVTTRRGVRAVWNGGTPKESLVVTALDGSDDPPARSHFGSGVLTWTMPWLFRTDPGWNLMARGPANWPKDGICALEGLIETDWSSATFTMNWLLTRSDHPVEFAPGEPICLLVPEQRGMLETVEPRITDVGGAAAEEYAAWRTSREEFNTRLRTGPRRPLIEQWQRDYFQGSTVSASAAGHQRRRVLAPFAPFKNPSSEGDSEESAGVTGAATDHAGNTATLTSVEATPVAHLPFLRRCVEAIRPTRVLVVDGDVLGWAAILQEPVPPSDPASPPLPPGDPARGAVGTIATVYPAIARDLDAALLRGPWDIVALGSRLSQHSRAVGAAALERALAAGAYVTATVPSGSGVKAGSAASASSGTRLDLADLLDRGARRHSVDPTSGTASVLLSTADAGGVGPIGASTPAWAQYAAADVGSRCGPGSSLAQTTVIRAELPGLFARHDVRSVVDVPCGDANWMRRVELGAVDYLGLDVSAELVSLARSAFEGSGDGRRQFARLDVLTDDLPRADLILCRDLLVHLPLAQVLAALTAFAASGSTYLLTTTFTDRTANADITTGNWRPLNLSCAPFSLPPPIEVLVEGCTEMGGRYADKSLGLWRLTDLINR